MKNILLVLMLLLFPVVVQAQEYTANTWASWASVTSQVNWVFPYNSRQVIIHNGSSIAICVSFGRSAVISPSCTDAANDVFQVGSNATFIMNNLVRPEIHIHSAGAAASPVSVVVSY